MIITLSWSPCTLSSLQEILPKYTHRFGRWGCGHLCLSIGLSRTIMGFYTVEWLGQIFMLKDNVCRVEAKILDKSRWMLVRIWTGKGIRSNEKKGHGILVVECKYSITLWKFYYSILSQPFPCWIRGMECNYFLPSGSSKTQPPMPLEKGIWLFWLLLI